MSRHKSNLMINNLQAKYQMKQNKILQIVIFFFCNNKFKAHKPNKEIAIECFDIPDNKTEKIINLLEKFNDHPEYDDNEAIELPAYKFIDNDIIYIGT